LIHALEDFLSSLIALEAHAVVLIDEAQHLQPEVLEQIRLLSNVSAPSGTMLQIILVGQLDLESLLTRPDLRQFQQRVSRRIRLAPLGAYELQAYIDHRLAIGRSAGSRMPGAGELARALDEWAGDREGVTFTPDAVEAIWRWSGGLPRLVNLLCDRALEAAYAQQLHRVDGALVEAAATALDLRTPSAPVASSQSPVPSPQSSDAVAPEPITPEPIAPKLITPEAVASPQSPVPSAQSPAPSPQPSDAVMPLRRRADDGGLQAYDPEPPTASAELRAPISPPLVEPDFAPVEAAPAASSSRTYGMIGLLAILVAAAFAVWFASRAPVTAVPPVRSAPAGPPASTAAPAAVPSTPPSAEPVATPTPAPATTPPATATPARAASDSASAIRNPTGTAFEILVASFRTEARAAAVEEQVTAAGLPVRRRVAAGWQQVIVGPFASREGADAARQRLDAAGLTGTQIVSVER
jgi:cell division protein FtsN